jgi:hypothetical protein
MQMNTFIFLPGESDYIIYHGKLSVAGKRQAGFFLIEMYSADYHADAS